MEKTNKLQFKSGAWEPREARASLPQGSMMPRDCRECEQWFCGECLPQCTCSSTIESRPHTSGYDIYDDDDALRGKIMGIEGCVVHSSKFLTLEFVICLQSSAHDIDIDIYMF